MLGIEYMLLCVAALSSHNVAAVRADFGSGRFGRRVLASNQTNTAAAVSSSAIEPTVSALSEYNGPEGSGVGPTYASSSSISSRSPITITEQSSTVAGLGFVTTAKRPSIVVQHSSSAATVSAVGGKPASETSQSSFNELTYSTQLATNSSSLNSTSTLLASAFSVTLKSTSSWNWVVTTLASGPSSAFDWTITTLSAVPAPTDDGGCPTTPDVVTVTKWSTIYPSTITWTGKPSDYTPSTTYPHPSPPPPTSTAECTPTTGRFSYSVCDGSGLTCTLYSTWPGSVSRGGSPTTGTVSTSVVFGTIPISTTSEKEKATFTVTFLTTDKNPVVVYPSPDTPDYGAGGGSSKQNSHHSVKNSVAETTPTHGRATSPVPAPFTYKQTAEPTNQSPSGDRSPVSSTAVTVVVRTTEVIINDQTFTDNPQTKTSTVVVGTDTFVIDPTQVVGAGATVARPSSIGGIFVPSPMTTTLGNQEVVYGPSVYSIDGTVLTAGPIPTTAVVNGQSYTVGPQGLVYSTQTLSPITEARSTGMVVLGAELITAIGPSLVVIEGTTITYGPGFSPSTEVIDGEIILIGPAGIIIRGTLLGGITAAMAATVYDMVGGATITQIGATEVVINDSTYTIGPAATATITTVIGGETLTIGPNGVTSSTVSLAQPYETRTTIVPGGTSAVASPTEEAQNQGRPLRPEWELGFIVTSIAIGTGFWGQLFC
ncbi:uncharacterized protein BCR38DRAFT_431782 [Pseudomassariella vexata]|uniref:Uncharacterized protein n=1 Tax=Pseudomassariella vexata TaxID=1141098 RepID=A0A1Y2E0K4_9PEZI|nr:uncharacterized protein BCR38DRAFT_431782 [Pseudomassariella vexata]ORY65071.1 hypothetical protein BCR38DRAFT_431782 [Pseudomassariella vexata]